MYAIPSEVVLHILSYIHVDPIITDGSSSIKALFGKFSQGFTNDIYLLYKSSSTTIYKAEHISMYVRKYNDPNFSFMCMVKPGWRKPLCNIGGIISVKTYVFNMRELYFTEGKFKNFGDFDFVNLEFLKISMLMDINVCGTYYRLKEMNIDFGTYTHIPHYFKGDFKDNGVTVIKTSRPDFIRSLRTYSKKSGKKFKFLYSIGRGQYVSPDSPRLAFTI